MTGVAALDKVVEGERRHTKVLDGFLVAAKSSARLITMFTEVRDSREKSSRNQRLCIEVYVPICLKFF